MVGAIWSVKQGPARRVRSHFAPRASPLLLESGECDARCRGGGSVFPEQVLDARIQRDRDLVQARDRWARLGPFNLRQQRNTKTGAPAHLFQRQFFVFAQATSAMSMRPRVTSSGVAGCGTEGDRRSGTVGLEARTNVTTRPGSRSATV